MKRTLVGLSAALAIGAAAPAVASAHDAVVVCNTNGTIDVVPDFLQYNPEWVIGEGVVHVVWTDGFTKTIPIPPACVPPVIPTPEIIPEPAPPPPDVPEVPTTPVVVTPPPVVPLTCAELLARYPKAGPKRRADWGCPAPVIKLPKPDKPPRKVTKRYIPCTGFGPNNRAKVIITVTLPSGKTGRVIKNGQICWIPKVTG